MRSKKERYKLIRISGLLFYMPAVLGAGPLSGYFLGEYLKKRFGIKTYVVIILILIGIFASIKEAVRIIRLVHKIDQE